MDKTVRLAIIAIMVLLVAGGGYLTYRAIKKARDEKKFNAQDVISNPRTAADMEKNRKALANIYANQLRTALNPSGNEWMIAFDTTDTASVMDISAKMKQSGVPFSYLASAYQTAFKDNLATRLQSELSSAELSKFYATAGMQGFGSLGAVTDALILA